MLSKAISISPVSALSNTDSEPNEIEVLDTVPTIAVPCLELLKSSYAMTTLLLLLSKAIPSFEVLALNVSAEPKLIDVPDTVPTIAWAFDVPFAHAITTLLELVSYVISVSLEAAELKTTFDPKLTLLSEGSIVATIAVP